MFSSALFISDDDLSPEPGDDTGPGGNNSAVSGLLAVSNSDTQRRKGRGVIIASVGGRRVLIVRLPARP